MRSLSPAPPPGEPEIPVESPPTVDRPFLGISLRLIAVVCGATMFATTKFVNVRGVHLVEIMFYRQLFALPLLLAWISWSTGLGVLRTRRFGLHLSRSAMGMLTMALNFGSFILLPLAEATTIGFMLPIFGTLLSALALKEPTGIHRWSAILVGFAGVLVIIQPAHGINLPALGLLVALAAAVSTAIVSVMLRTFAKAEHPSAIVFYFTVIPLPFLGLAVLIYGGAHDAFSWGMLVAIGVLGCVSQLCMTLSLRFAPVSMVLPMDYSTLLWTSLIGWQVYGTWPGPATLIGAVLIIGSGLYIVWRERVRAAAARPEPI